MDLYDTITAIEEGDAKATYKKVAEVKAQKKEKQNEDAKKYFQIDIILYRDYNSEYKKYGKQKTVKKHTAKYEQYGFVQLSVKAPKTFPPNLIDKLITERYDGKEFERIFQMLMTNEEFQNRREQHIYNSF